MTATAVKGAKASEPWLTANQERSQEQSWWQFQSEESEPTNLHLDQS